MYQFLAQFAMMVHFAVLAYMALGGFLAWLWPKTWFVHAAFAGWATLNLFVTVYCPLTWVENELRAAAGWERLTGAGFIDHYITGELYPADQEAAARLIVGVLVVISWVGMAIIWRRARAGETGARMDQRTMTSTEPASRS